MAEEFNDPPMPQDMSQSPPPQDSARPNDDNDRSRGRSRSRSRDRSRSPCRSMSPRRRAPPPVTSRSAMGKQPEPNTILGVFNLSIHATEQDLSEEFTKFGEVESIAIMYDRTSGRPRGFAFVKFVRLEDATAARDALTGMDLCGRQVRVDYSLTGGPHKSTPGQYMGKRHDSPPRGGDRRYDDYRPRYDDRGPPPSRYDSRGPPPSRYDDRPRYRDSYDDRGRGGYDRRSPPPPRGRSRSRSPRRRSPGPPGGRDYPPADRGSNW